MRGSAAVLLLALCPWPGLGQEAGSGPAPEFQLSALPDLPNISAPSAPSFWTQHRAEPPADAGRTEGFNFDKVEEAALAKYTAAVEFERTDAAPEEKAAKWRGLGRQVKALAEGAARRASQWEDYAAQRALDALLENESDDFPPEEKAARWLELARKFPRYAQPAQAQAEKWRNFARELAKVEAIKLRRAKLRDQDWAKLGPLLALAASGEADKRKFAASFIQAYGKSVGDNPYIAKLLPFLPKEMLTTKEANDIAGIQWVTIFGGSFVMGSQDLGAACLPRHRVSVPTFQLAKTLVTNGQYRACVAAGACTPAGDCPENLKSDELPVTCVAWDQARAFAQWVGGKLPTEAQWEYAARSRGQEQKYPWGDAEPTCKLVVFNDANWPRTGNLGCGKNSTWPVCSKPKGDTAQGLCDMAGNAYEWMEDGYHDSYNDAPRDGSAWESPGEPLHVIRGGSWLHSAANCPAAARDSAAAGGSHIGFRPAR